MYASVTAEMQNRVDHEFLNMREPIIDLDEEDDYKRQAEAAIKRMKAHKKAMAEKAKLMNTLTADNIISRIEDDTKQLKIEENEHVHDPSEIIYELFYHKLKEIY